MYNIALFIGFHTSQVVSRISAINRIMENGKKHSAISKDLEKFAASARTELGKVRRIQAGLFKKGRDQWFGGWFLKKGGGGFKWSVFYIFVVIDFA